MTRDQGTRDDGTFTITREQFLAAMERQYGSRDPKLLIAEITRDIQDLLNGDAGPLTLRAMRGVEMRGVENEVMEASHGDVDCFDPGDEDRS